MRITKLEDFIGQDDLKKRLEIMIPAAQRNGYMDHILLAGSSGAGKTTIARIIANMLGWELVELNGAMIKPKSHEIYKHLFNMYYEGFTVPKIIFIDEIHRVPMVEAESMYKVMEDRAILDVPINFCILGATNRIGSMPEPLVNRFGVLHYLDKYSADEMYKIVKLTAGMLEAEIDDESAMIVAVASRSTPRVAQLLLKQISDYTKDIHVDDVDKIFDMIGVDRQGLTKIDLRYLNGVEKRGNNPQSLKNLSSIVDETTDTIENKIEPYLLELGLIEQTPRGRILTKDGLKYIGSTIPSFTDMKKILGF